MQPVNNIRHRWLPNAVLVCIAASGVVVFAQKSGTPAQRDRGFAAVVDSGSTNADGFRILVERTGKTQRIVLPRQPPPQPIELPVPVIGMISTELVNRLYSDLDAAWPLTSLPKPRCPKSVSFGTRLTIAFDYQSTPDLNCGDAKNPKLRALIDDAHEIVKPSGK